MPKIHSLDSYAKGNPPFSDEKKSEATQVTFPDLHGNALAALYRLEAEGILELTSDQRQRLAAIYFESENTTPDALTEFEKILDNVIVHPDRYKCVRFIGDVLGDRGKNDILTLLVLKKLKDSKVNTTIVFSNHDLEIITWRLSKQVTDPNCKSLLAAPTVAQRKSQRRSLDNLITFIEKEANQEFYPSIYHLIDEVYKPMLKIIDYTVKDRETCPLITLYTHAPAGLELLESLARRYHISYYPTTPEKLIDIIDQINANFAHEVLHEPDKFADELARELKDFRGTPEDASIDPRQNPFVYAAWNRSEKYLRSSLNPLYEIENIHGHMGYNDSPWEKITHKRVNFKNLDYKNDLGRSSPDEDKTYPFGSDSDHLRHHWDGYPPVPTLRNFTSSSRFFSPPNQSFSEIKKSLLAPYLEDPQFKKKVTEEIKNISMNEARNLSSAYALVTGRLMTFEEARKLTPAQKGAIDSVLNTKHDEPFIPGGLPATTEKILQIKENLKIVEDLQAKQKPSNRK